MRRGLVNNRRCLPYDPKLIERAREMRNNSTKGEIKFWSELLRNEISGYQFNRQKPILWYIVDFYCAKLKLVVEIDGSSHDDKEEYDANRDKELQSLNLKVLHYDDLAVLNNFHTIEKDFTKQIRVRERELNLG